jgi:hypothetical protein
MLKKSTEGITSTAANRVGQEVSVALLTSEFDKLGLREAFISSFESRSKYW